MGGYEVGLEVFRLGGDEGTEVGLDLVVTDRVTIPEGEYFGGVPIEVIPDSLTEGVELFEVRLVDAEGDVSFDGTLSSATFWVTDVSVSPESGWVITGR